jgi:hypothetical protein
VNDGDIGTDGDGTCGDTEKEFKIQETHVPRRDAEWPRRSRPARSPLPW